MEAIKESPIHILQKKTLDKMYKQAEEITEAYNSKYIPSNLLHKLLNGYRANSGDKSKAVKAMEKSWNKLLDALYATSYNYCRENDLDYKLPMIVFKEYIGICKDNLKG